MVIHTQVDWRTPQQALEWDLSLVRGVFYRLSRQYDAEHLKKRTRRPRRITTTDNQVEEATDDVDAAPHKFDEQRLVTKADVLIGLKTTENFLDKRPFLRALYTNLACCSNEKEMESVSSYVKYRVRERTISYTMVAAKLKEIYKKHMDLLAFEAKIDEFKAAARAKSTWCVRDPKAICKAPSKYYGVHNIPPKPKTQKQIDAENQLIRSHAVAVAHNAIALVVSQLVDGVRQKSRQRSAKSGKHNSGRRGSNTGSGEQERVADSSGSTVRDNGVARAKQKRDQQQAETRRKELRLQIFAPGLVRTRQSTSFGYLHFNEGTQQKEKQRKQQELLALVEANGDVTIAEQLFLQKIPHSGFSRVAEHLGNLAGGESSDPDEWAVIKLWKTVYRNRTTQAIQRLEQ